MTADDVAAGPMTTAGGTGLSPVSAFDAVWAAAREVVKYPYPRVRAISALKDALQDYDDLLAAMAADFLAARAPSEEQ